MSNSGASSLSEAHSQITNASVCVRPQDLTSGGSTDSLDGEASIARNTVPSESRNSPPASSASANEASTSDASSSKRKGKLKQGKKRIKSTSDSQGLHVQRLKGSTHIHEQRPHRRRIIDEANDEAEDAAHTETMDNLSVRISALQADNRNLASRNSRALDSNKELELKLARCEEKCQQAQLDQLAFTVTLERLRQQLKLLEAAAKG